MPTSFLIVSVQKFLGRDVSTSGLAKCNKKF
jgi:hypothetical protein